LPSGPVWHFDFYRLKRPEEAWELGIEDAFAEGISLVEWPERAAAVLPADRLEITLRQGPTADARRAELAGGPGWAARLTALATTGRAP
jgi:tRNA threonylcarbamoyladenosine biosynthesis protein TsaE